MIKLFFDHPLFKSGGFRSTSLLYATPQPHPPHSIHARSKEKRLNDSSPCIHPSFVAFNSVEREVKIPPSPTRSRPTHPPQRHDRQPAKPSSNSNSAFPCDTHGSAGSARGSNLWRSFMPSRTSSTSCGLTSRGTHSEKSSEQRGTTN